MYLQSDSGEEDVVFRLLLLTVIIVFAVSAFTQSTAYADGVPEGAVEELNNRVARLYEKGRYEEAIALAKKALASNEETYGRDHEIVAVSLNNLATLYETTGDYNRARELHEQSLDIRKRRFGAHHPSYAISLNNLGSVYEKTGEYRKAQSLFEQARGILVKEHPELVIERLAVEENIAKILKILGDIEQAELNYERILLAKKKIFPGDSPEIAKTYNNLALIKQILGDFSSAEKYYLESLSIRKKQLRDEHPVIANSLNNLGSLHEQAGNFVSARNYYEQSLYIGMKSLGVDHPDVATIQNNLGILYKSIGNYAQARALLTDSLTVRKAVLGDNHPGLTANLNNLAELLYFEGNYPEAETLYKESLQVAESEFGPHHPFVAAVMVNLAGLYIEAGKFDKAIHLIERHESPMLMGYYRLKTGDFRQAVAQFHDALQINEQLGKTRFLPVNHIGLGNAYEQLRDLERAKEHYLKAIDIIESQWIGLDVSSKRTFLSGRIGLNYTRLDAYEGIIRVILRTGTVSAAEEALEYAEKIKSRILLEMLAGKRLSSRNSVEAEILKKERNLQDRIYKARFKLTQLVRLEREPTPEIKTARRNLRSLHHQYESFINEIKFSSSEIVDLLTVETIDSKQLQAQLDDQTTLVEYLITGESVYIWLISNQQVDTITIPIGSAALERQINELLLPDISSRARKPAPRITVSTGRTTEEMSGEYRVDNQNDFITHLSEIGNLLISPIKEKIKTPKLIIVPHGGLHKIPFPALIVEGSSLLDRYEISTIPSASVLQKVQQQKNEDKDRLLAFSNPQTVFPSLFYAEEEVKNIKRYFDHKTIYFGSHATETRAKRESRTADIIHFASHGEFNDQQPMQSGLILAKDAENDGYLQVHEIFGLDLAEANLVALSACDTGLSKIQGGDDLIGLSRGFIYAGAPAILATLWQIDDRASAQLVNLFYDNWRNKGLTKTNALRQAQLAIRSKPEFRHPYFWAPFVLIGN